MTTTRTLHGYLETDSVPRSRSAAPDLDALAHLMDGAFRIPGLNLRFGLDAIIGLIPGLGDLITTLISLYVLAAAQRYGVPRITMARMGLNVAVDAIIGAVPLVGDLFDVAWKANERNVALVQRHLSTPLHARGKARRGDWLYVAGIVSVLLAILSAAVYGAFMAAAAVVNWLGG